MAEQIITGDKVASIHYVLRNDEGKVLDSSSGRAPLAYLHGHGNIVPGLERRLEGHKAGDKVQAVVPPSEGYGESTGEPQAVHRREFPKDVQLYEGMPFRATNSAGEEVVLWIHAIRGAQIYVHTDHPLAGQTLHFDIDIVDVRDASEDEIAHGHVHGPGGAH